MRSTARLLSYLCLTALLARAADLPPVWVAQKTPDVEISARLILDREAHLQAVGADLGRQYVVVELKVTPKGGYPVTLDRDQFLLRSSRDNERSTAESPDRIAGSTILVLGAKSTGGRGIFSESGDPVFVGGLPGTGGRPRRIGGDETGIGSAAGPSETTVASSSAKVTPLLSALRDKEMPLGEHRKPVTGFLYFPVDPKQKPKNFHLHFKGPGGEAEIQFR